MSFIENPLKKGLKWVKTTNENIIYKKEKVSIKIDFFKAIKIMVKIIYKKEYSKKEETIYSFDEMRNTF